MNKLPGHGPTTSASALDRRVAIAPAVRASGLAALRRSTCGGLVLALALLAGLMLAGCGGSSDNGVANKSAQEILQASKEAAEGASSVHVVVKAATGSKPLTSNLELSRESAHASLAYAGLAYEMTRIGGTLYVKGSPSFLGSLTGSTRKISQGTWLKGPATGKLAQLAAFTDLPGELDRMLSTPGTVTKGASTTVNGQQVIELKETTKVYKGVLYVATTGKPHPVVLVKTGGREKGRTTFSEWDEPVSLTAPSPVVDIGSLKGGA